MYPKFRAWDNQAKEMFDVVMINFEKQSLLLSKGNGIGWGSYPIGCELLQSTGFTDKEIYDRDIIEFTDFSSGHPWVVKLGEYRSGDMIELHMGWFLECSYAQTPLTKELPIRVIGNVKENPELLLEKL